LCAGILIVISVAVFGSYFNVGQAYSLPYGWSYWIAVVSAVMFFLNSIAMAFISTATRSKASISDVALIRRHQEMESVA
jgi:hypothetical protein